MDCVGLTDFETAGDSVPVWVIQPWIRKTTDTEMAPIARKTEIYIAADESKDIVKIETEPGIGTVTLRLVRYLEQ